MCRPTDASIDVGRHRGLEKAGRHAGGDIGRCLSYCQRLVFSSIAGKQAVALEQGAQRVARDAEQTRGLNLVFSAPLEGLPHQAAFDGLVQIFWPCGEHVVQGA